jgi:hypothetical protein
MAWLSLDVPPRPSLHLELAGVGAVDIKLCDGLIVVKHGVLQAP